MATPEFEFRRQHSRVWWSNFDDIGSPVAAPVAALMAGAAAVRSPAAAASTPSSASPPAAMNDVVSPQGDARDSSSSPSTSHKSQDSGFSDSDGSHHQAHASPEVCDAAQLSSQLASTPSPTHTRLQLCLSGACTTTPLGPGPGGPAGPATFGGHATPVELRKRLSQDDSCIQARPLPAVPVLRRQCSAEEQQQARQARWAASRSVVLDGVLGGVLGGDPPASPLNQTFPLAGPADACHRALRSFIKNRRPSACPGRRRYGRAPPEDVPDVDSMADTVSCSEAFGEAHATVLERPASTCTRTHPDGGEAPPAVLEVADDGQAFLMGMGTPAHTSTPKATPKNASSVFVTVAAATSTPKATPVAYRAPPPAALGGSTPTRRPPGLSALPGYRRLHDKRNARPVNLLSNFDKAPSDAAFDAVLDALVPEAVSEAASVAGGAVTAWLGQLRLACEPECSVALQSKALLGADIKGLRQLSGLQLTSPQGLGQLQRRAHLLSCEYTRLCGRVQRGALDQVGPLTEALVRHVLDFLRDYGEAGAVPRERADRLRAACDRLRADAGREQPVGPEPADMAASLAGLRAALTATVDAILDKQVQELVGVLEGPASPLALRAAVSALCALGRQGSALADLVVRGGGVRALLQVVLDARTSPTRRAALRALAAVCCTARAVRSLEQAGGVEVVAELLAEDGRPEEELAEAAAVLAQITAPWVPDNARVEGLARHLDSVVHALTRLVRTASSSESLLLAAAALAHLSYVESSAVWPLLSAGAAGAVLQAVRAQGPRCSVFLQEQAATLVANMSAVPEARAELAADRAVVALLCFLQLRPSPLQRSADIAAAERVQHKAAIALSRMASDPEVARQVVSLEGVPRLVRLCRDERERNHSDGVLVACLAALRKIAANCGSVVLSKRDRKELLEPRLLDSFMLFSTRQESYV